MIIDMHCHLGDILYPGGGARILTGMPMAHPFDPDALRRLALYRFHALDRSFYKLPRVQWLMTRAERMRNFTGTLSNLTHNMDRFGISHAAVMPVAPNTAFEDLLPAVQADPRLLPFGSFDFTSPDYPSQGHRQLSQGARGIKLHPILQRVAPDGPEVAAALSPLPPGTVMLLHAGVSNYYPRREANLQTPEFGGIAGIGRLCRAFPHLRFVAAHGGLNEFKELLVQLSPLPNVCVDTSFVSPGGIQALIDSFGPERVLFASDWPWGYHRTGLDCVRMACRGRQKELELVLGGNAIRLLGL